MNIGISSSLPISPPQPFFVRDIFFSGRHERPRGHLPSRPVDHGVSPRPQGPAPAGRGVNRLEERLLGLVLDPAHPPGTFPPAGLRAYSSLPCLPSLLNRWPSPHWSDSNATIYRPQIVCHPHRPSTVFRTGSGIVSQSGGWPHRSGLRADDRSPGVGGGDGTLTFKTTHS